MQTASGTGDLLAERYRLVDRLGAGGMGTVWRAKDELLERMVALKEVVIPAGLPDAEVTRLRRRYLREARAAARLQHENVVVVHDVISQVNTVWIVMELLECPDLAAIVNDDGPLTPAEVARIGLHVLEALVAAHAAGVLHRDVKPANVLITGSGRAVLTDFGVASVAGDASLTATGQLIGSPAYFAPERLTGDTAGPPSDLWSLGCTLYAAVEGKSPFLRAEPFEILSAITVEALAPPRKAGRLAPVLYGLLEKDPSQRWDADRTRTALERVAAGMAVASSPAWGVVDNGLGDTTEVRLAKPAAGPAVRTAATGSGAAPRTEPAPQPVTARTRRSRVRLTILLVLLAVLVGAAAAVAYTPMRNSLFGQGSEADATLDGSPGDPEPVGAAYTSPEFGYSLRVPSGWVTECANGLCRFSGDDSTRASSSTMNVFVEVMPAEGKSSLTLSRAYDKQLATDTRHFPEYERLRLAPAKPARYTGTVHEFTYVNPVAGARHVVIFRTVSKGLSYSVSLNGPEDRFAESRSRFDLMLESLRIPS